MKQGQKTGVRMRQYKAMDVAEIRKNANMTDWRQADLAIKSFKWSLNTYLANAVKGKLDLSSPTVLAWPPL